MKTLSKRLKFARELRRLSQPDVVRLVNDLRGKKVISQQAYSLLERGESETSKELPAICEVLGADLGWIRDGKGLPPAASGHELDGKKVTSSVDLDLSPGLRNVCIEANVRTGAGGGGMPTEAYRHDGNGNIFAAEEIAGEWILPPAVMDGVLHSKPKDIVIFEVVGDSMEPRLHEGDRVFVDTRQTNPHPEGIFVLWDGDGIVVKRLQIVPKSNPQRIFIIAENQQYGKREMLLDEIKIIGRVAGRFTTK